MGKFDAKTFNERAFAKYIETVPKLRKNELIKSRALRGNSQIKQAFSGQTGVVFATIPMYGRVGGSPLNYDGQTDITATSTTTYERNVIVIGRSKAWVEKDFSEDITDKAGFMSNVARQVSDYWDEIDQDTLLFILEGIFSMKGSQNIKFIENHTYNITKEENGIVGAPTLNNAIQKASGDKKSKFTISIMHSAIATNLENLKLLSYMTYTDNLGIERQLDLATWNGRIVIIDDGMPTKEIKGHYIKCNKEDNNALKVIEDTGKPNKNEIKLSDTKIQVEVGEYVKYIENYMEYTTYVLGDGAFDYENIGAEVPYAMVRDEKTNGGQTYLYTRQRKVFAPYGISFTKVNMATNSPTDEELKDGANWELVHDGSKGEKRKYFDHKAIPIARIISRG